MARGLYRVYLYVVTIALAVFLTVVAATMLDTLLRLTGLRGSYSTAPASSEITRAVVQFVVVLIVVVGLGGLHYWLIRRDMASDPQAGASGVRSFTLNLALLGATLVAVFAGAAALASFSLTFQNSIDSSAAAALAALGLVAALEWERHRATPTRGAALVFQRLRVDGVPLILALSLLYFVTDAANKTEQLIGQSAGILQCSPTELNGPFVGPYYGLCIGSELIGKWAAALLVIIVWLVYLRLGANGQRTLIRPIFLLLGFLAGIGALVEGLQRAVEFALRWATSTANARPDYINQFDAAPVVLYAAIVLSVYGWRLLRADSYEPLDAPTTHLSMRAIAGAVFAIPFWVGVDMLLVNTFIKLFPGPQAVDTNWHQAIANVIAGAAYVPLALWLGAGSRAEGVKGPRRGFVLALLAAGALATAGGGATLLYSVVTAALGVPLPDWQSVARQAGAALIVGLVLGGLYLWLAVREGQFARAPHPQAEPTSPTEPTTAGANGHAAALDEVLAQFQQGSLTQAEAADRIRELARSGSLL